MSLNIQERDLVTGELKRTIVAGNSNIVDTAIKTDSTWSSKKINDSLVNIADKLEKNVKFDVDDLNTAYVPNKTITVRTNKNTKNLPPSSLVNFLVTSFAYVEGQYYRITQYCYENSENLSCSMYVRRGVSNAGESSITWSAWGELATSADLADKQDFRIFNSLEEFNKKKGTSLTVVSGIDNMKDIANAMSNGEILIIITKCELGSEVYFGLTTDTGWTKMFTFVKSNGLCDVECRTTFPLTLKRVLNSDGVVGDWQQLVTTTEVAHVKRFYSVPGNDWNNAIEEGYYDIPFDVQANAIKNRPFDFALQMRVITSDTNDPNYVYQIAYVSSQDSRIFIRKLNGDGNWTPWKKVCTTTVEDVPKTYINTFEDETYVKPTMSNVCSYYVTNGFCVIKLETVCLSTTDDFVQIVSGLPKPKEVLYSNVIDRTMSANTGAKGLFQLITDGTLRIVCDYGDTSVTNVRNFYASFSYPVAES